MNQLNNLSEVQNQEIIELANEKRQSLGFIGDTPLANDIFTILDQLNIILLEYPIQSENNKPAFSAVISYLKEDDEELVFIGLNTSDYFDKQIFAIAHELYHYYTKTKSHLSRLENEEDSILEVKANRFAAELLLPETVLKRIIVNDFKSSNLVKVPTQKLLRFIVRLQCNWWLPYRSIVKLLNEIGAISKIQYNELNKIDERDLHGNYGVLGKAVCAEIFTKLNTITNTVGTSSNQIEIIIRNFEDHLIDEDKLSETLNLFNKTPEDFGYKIEVLKEDLKEINDLFDELTVDDS